MATQNLSAAKTWKNTFAPTVRNREFTAEDLFCGVRHARISMSDLPEDARKAVREIAGRVYGKK